MTEQQKIAGLRVAIKTLKTEHLGDTELMELAKHLGADALERQVPKKPKEATDAFGDFTICCPLCGGPVTNYWTPRTQPKHCQFCGQALDWREESKG